MRHKLVELASPRKLQYIFPNLDVFNYATLITNFRDIVCTWTYFTSNSYSVINTSRNFCMNLYLIICGKSGMANGIKNTTSCTYHSSAGILFLLLHHICQQV